MAGPDLTYSTAGMFVAFYPETAAGGAAWTELAAHSDGTAKFLPTQIDAIIVQLRAAGMIVAAVQSRNRQFVGDVAAVAATSLPNSQTTTMIAQP